MPGRQYQASDYRYGFNDKEKDDEIKGNGNSLDFGARMYDTRLGRFLSIDPKYQEYPDWSPYLFAANCPIKFIDVNGEGPGDLFKSMDEAAHDWGMTYNGKSIRRNREYRSVIYKVVKDGDILYTYNKPHVGKKATGRNAQVSDKFKLKNGQEEVARIHSHAAYSSDPEHVNEYLSPIDEIHAEDRGNPEYVATPQGGLVKYDPNVDKTYRDENKQLVFPKDYIKPMFTDLPSDRNDPSHLNNNFANPLKGGMNLTNPAKGNTNFKTGGTKAGGGGSGEKKTKTTKSTAFF